MGSILFMGKGVIRFSKIRIIMVISGTGKLLPTERSFHAVAVAAAHKVILKACKAVRRVGINQVKLILNKKKKLTEPGQLLSFENGIDLVDPEFLFYKRKNIIGRL